MVKKHKAKVKSKVKSKAVKKFHHVIILDKSGSMGDIRDATMEGFNLQVSNIKSLAKKGNHKVTVTTFNHNVEMDVFNQPANELIEITSTSYVPNGYTALNDAIGITFTKLKDEIDKNTNVMVSIITDGLENASKKWSTTGVKQLIEEVQAKNKWTVTYLGANQNVAAVAQGYSIPTSNTAVYSSDPKSAGLMFSHMAHARTCYTKTLSAHKGPSGQSVNCVYSASASTPLDLTSKNNKKP